MKKTAALLLALLFVLCAFPAAMADGVTLTAGDEAGLTGKFNPDFDTGAGDATVAGLLTGGWLYEKDADGLPVLNPLAVESVSEIGTGEGTVIYDFKLNTAQRWSDGEPVKAEDYAAAFLIRSMPAYEDAGAYAEGGYYLEGYWDFYEGETKAFRGVHLLGEYEFTAELAAEYASGGYAYALVNTFPMRLSLYASGATLEETEDGVQLSKKPDKTKFAEAVKKESKKPTVTCGAYTLEKYDKTTLTAKLIANPFYAGGAPAFENIAYRSLKAGAGEKLLREGKIDVLLHVTDKSAAANTLRMAEENGIVSLAYDTPVLNALIFDCGAGAAASQSVRKAVAAAFDRSTLVNTMTGGNASVHDGYFTGAVYGARVNAEALSSLPAFGTADKKEAEKLLEKDGWTYAQDGSKYESGVRYRKNETGEIEPLAIEFVYQDKDALGETCSKLLTEALEPLGVQFTSKPLAKQKYYEALYDRETRTTANLFLRTVTFGAYYDPAETYTDDEALNLFRVYDEELITLATALHEADPAGESYGEAFTAFNGRWNETAPLIPLYAERVYSFAREGVELPGISYYTAAGTGILKAGPAGNGEITE